MNADFTFTEGVFGGPGFEPGRVLTLTVDFADGSPPFEESRIAGAGGEVPFCEPIDPCPFSLGEGDVVTVTDDSVPPQMATLTMPFFTLTGVDLDADMVWGTGRSGDMVTVVIQPAPIAEVTALVDSSGSWTADFTGVHDMRVDTCATVQEARGDGVVAIGFEEVGLCQPGPSVVVGPDSDIVGSDHRSSWTPGATISLTIEDGNGVAYTDSQMVDLSGWFNFNLGGVFDVQRGHIVTVSDGATTKTHAVTNLYVDGIDVAADTVFGRADAGTELGVWVPGELLTVTADSSGSWTADFSAITDLTYTSNGSAQQFDDDGDATWIPWAIIEVDVGIDIKPGSDTNPVNLKSKGVIPVAILTTDDFDATTVDPISVAFGPAGASEAHGRGHFSDVDHDGDIDLMLHFRTQNTGIQAGDTEACLAAQTLDGQAIVGCDLITAR